MNTLSPVSVPQVDLGQPLDRQATALQQSVKTPVGPDPQRVHDAFTQFVGETFYSQMLKAMRTSLDKPAYFHGGRGEEVFANQLDQTLAEQLADNSTERFIEPMFRQQFPHLAEQLKRMEKDIANEARTPLNLLRRW